MGLEKTSNPPRARQGPGTCLCTGRAGHIPRAMPGKQRLRQPFGSSSPQMHPLGALRREGIPLCSLQQQAGISMPLHCLWDTGWRGDGEKLIQVSQCLNKSQTLFGVGGWRGETDFFSPLHPGHWVSQGSGNRGAGPAPPAPQARPRRVRKFREGLPTSSWERWWLFHHVEKPSSVFGLTLT